MTAIINFSREEKIEIKEDIDVALTIATPLLSKRKGKLTFPLDVRLDDGTSFKFAIYSKGFIPEPNGYEAGSLFFGELHVLNSDMEQVDNIALGYYNHDGKLVAEMPLE